MELVSSVISKKCRRRRYAFYILSILCSEFKSWNLNRKASNIQGKLTFRGKGLRIITISIPESSGFFVSGWSPGETLGQWDRSAPGFPPQNNRALHETANQKKNILSDFPRVSPGDQPLTKKPEDSGIEIEIIMEIKKRRAQSTLLAVRNNEQKLKKCSSRLLSLFLLSATRVTSTELTVMLSCWKRILCISDNFYSSGDYELLLSQYVSCSSLIVLIKYDKLSANNKTITVYLELFNWLFNTGIHRNVSTQVICRFQLACVASAWVI